MTAAVGHVSTLGSLASEAGNSEAGRPSGSTSRLEHSHSLPSELTDHLGKALFEKCPVLAQDLWVGAELLLEQ